MCGFEDFMGLIHITEKSDTYKICGQSRFMSIEHILSRKGQKTTVGRLGVSKQWINCVFPFQWSDLQKV